MITVLANGCFDILHVGHLWHLQKAAEYGDRLIVSVTSDEWVNKGPGRPVNKYEYRAELLEALRIVHGTVKANSGAEAILKVKPDIYVKGCDRSYKTITPEERVALKKVGAKVIFTRTRKMSSTNILEQILKGA